MYHKSTHHQYIHLYILISLPPDCEGTRSISDSVAQNLRPAEQCTAKMVSSCDWYLASWFGLGLQGRGLPMHQPTPHTPHTPLRCFLSLSITKISQLFMLYVHLSV